MYKFLPILKTLVWGTELWLISSVPGNESVVACGPEAGKTLNDIYGGQFPLLIKLIDAHADLSIQVHPDDALAWERHKSKGKTEMWYVTGATQDAHLLAGFSQPVSKEEYKAKVADGTITDVLKRYNVSVGDVFYIPSGRIHAICSGTQVAEIQQTSDITYRIYDYGRLGLDGKPRQLHTEEALDAIDYTVLPDYRTQYEDVKNAENEIVKSPFFTTSLYELDTPVTKALDQVGKFLVVICIDGEGTLKTDSDSVELKKGEAVLVKADEKAVTFSPNSSMKLLTSYID